MCRAGGYCPGERTTVWAVSRELSTLLPVIISSYGNVISRMVPGLPWDIEQFV